MHGRGDVCPKECLGVGSEHASIFHGKWDQDLLVTVRSVDRLRGVHVRTELLDLNLLSCISWDVGYLLEHCVFVHRDDGRIDDHMSSIREEV